MVAGLCAGAVAVRVRDPNTAGLWPTCPVHALTGGFCPGCGSMRGLAALTHGDVVAAFGYNPLLVPALLWVVWWLWRSRVPGRSFSSPAGIWVGVAVVAVFTVLRNIPGSPFLFE